MKKLQMPEIVTPKPTRFLIPGGWIMRVPDFAADPEYEGLLTGVLLPQYRHDTVKARADARQRIDAMCRYAYLHTAKEFLVRTAVDYGRRFPLVVQKDRTLRGFDPEAVMRLHIPYSTARGKGGRVDLRNLMVEMAR